MADDKVERMLLHVRGSNPVSRLKYLVKLVEMQYQCLVTSPELISFKASVPADILSTSFHFYRQKRQLETWLPPLLPENKITAFCMKKINNY